MDIVLVLCVRREDVASHLSVAIGAAAIGEDARNARWAVVGGFAILARVCALECLSASVEARLEGSDVHLSENRDWIR